jgi:hypothetical protein
MRISPKNNKNGWELIIKTIIDLYFFFNISTLHIQLFYFSKSKKYCQKHTIFTQQNLK